LPVHGRVACIDDLNPVYDSSLFPGNLPDWNYSLPPGIKQTSLSLTVVVDMDNDKIETASKRGNERITCAGECGGSGLCPGQAILLSLGAGYGLSTLTGWEWMQPLVLVVGSILLMTGWYRYLNPIRVINLKDR